MTFVISVVRGDLVATKSFNHKDFLNFDQQAREKATRYLANAGYLVKDNPDQYGIDLLCECKKSNKPFGVEVEIKKGWRGEFDFETLHIPYRKKKFVDQNALFFVFSSHLFSVAIVSSTVIRNCNVIEKENYKVEGKEKFFDIPVNLIKLAKLDF